MKQSRRAVVLTAALVLGGTGIGVAPGAEAAPPVRCASRHNDSVRKVLECVTVEGMLEHEQALQAIADANGDTRSSGTAGYDASVDYVVERTEAIGLDVSVQPFSYHRFEVLGPSVLQQTAPGTITYVEDTDFGPTPHSEPGDVTASVTAVDLQLGRGRTGEHRWAADAPVRERAS